MFAPLLLLTTLASNPAAEPPFSQVVAEASAAGTPIVLDIYTVWCKPCQMMDREVFPHPEVQPVLSGFRFQRYDAEAGEGLQVATRFNISNYPAVLVLTPEGHEVERIWAQTPGPFAAHLRALRALASVRGPFTEEERARRPRDAALLYVSGLILKQEEADSPQAHALFTRAEAADAGNRLGVAERAGFERLRREASVRRAAAESTLLASYTERYPSSVHAIKALQGMAAMPAEARPATLPKLTARVTEAFVKAADLDGLESITRLHLNQGNTAEAARVALRMTKLKPEHPLALWTLAEVRFSERKREEAVLLQKRVVALLPGDEDAAGDLRRYETETPPPPTLRYRSPLAPSSGSSLPPELRAELAARSQIGKKLAKACTAELGSESELYVRLYPKARKVERAVLLDPEAPAALSACVARALVGHEEPALGDRARLTWQIMLTK